MDVQPRDHPMTAANPRRSTARTVAVWLGGIVAAVVLVGIVGVVIGLANGPAAVSADVGTCLAESSGKKLDVVDCGTSGAAYRVVARIPSQDKGGMDACREHPDAAVAYWEGKSGSSGTVLCLAKL